jgi:hypothetical protein
MIPGWEYTWDVNLAAHKNSEMKALEGTIYMCRKVHVLYTQGCELCWVVGTLYRDGNIIAHDRRPAQKSVP